jgi:hypothetical protein
VTLTRGERASVFEEERGPVLSREERGPLVLAFRLCSREERETQRGERFRGERTSLLSLLVKRREQWRGERGPLLSRECVREERGPLRLKEQRFLSLLALLVQKYKY